MLDLKVSDMRLVKSTAHQADLNAFQLWMDDKTVESACRLVPCLAACCFGFQAALSGHFTLSTFQMFWTLFSALSLAGVKGLPKVLTPLKVSPVFHITTRNMFLCVI